ncbi:NAD(+) diphosphatase [Roseomonas indoligenes]|uniref:NAD(+) diphosphatase n=1 Tax=Roseomonas indoligenes TaxID=2820811 RepID=A0A940S6F9_9PROT|nr:NAD(+) diphosphatase [Pararoseomonas indoligenes]MBP0493915.1 NAD(+) diphosphatase [Pararoseomonas indoligenes]
MLTIPASRPNAYTGSPLDRVSDRRDDADFVAAALASKESLIAPVWRSKSLLRGVESGAPEAVLLTREAAETVLMAGGPWALLGLNDGTPVFTVDCSAAEDPLPLLPEGMGAFHDLRAVAGLLPPGEASMLAHARGLMHWRTRHRFCGVCGNTCEPRSAGNAMACTHCGAQHFPRTDPAVIMLVVNGDECLLGHSTRFPNSTMYSTLAGFVEPGESLEEAVRREVKEETGVLVGACHYHSSQPWPFPASIMLGFHAEALSREVTIDPNELRDARWFTREEIRNPEAAGFSLPRVDSIARRLIEDWLEHTP